MVKFFRISVLVNVRFKTGFKIIITTIAYYDTQNMKSVLTITVETYLAMKQMVNIKICMTFSCSKMF